MLRNLCGGSFEPETVYSESWGYLPELDMELVVH